MGLVCFTRVTDSDVRRDTADYYMRFTEMHGSWGIISLHMDLIGYTIVPFHLVYWIGGLCDSSSYVILV